MNKLNGGYIMIDGTSSTLQADLKKAYETGRPVLWYENDKSVYVKIEQIGYKYYAKDTNFKYQIGVSGTNADNKEFNICFYTNIRNYKDIDTNVLAQSYFTIVNTDENTFDEQSYETITGFIENNRVMFVYEAPSNAVKYLLFAINNSTNVEFEY